MTDAPRWIRVCVMADDLGMHPAVNEGIVRAFQDGLLTDTNLMAPPPAFDEGAALARAHAIPVGLHATFTCDWDRYRWGPLTDAPSLTAEDGCFRNSANEAWATASKEEAIRELRAQWDRITAAGLEMTHLGDHMGVDEAGKGARVLGRFATEHDLPLRGDWDEYPDGFRRYAFDSSIAFTCSSADLDEAKLRLREWLTGLEPGRHLWLTHPAVDDPALDNMCSPDHPPAVWARHGRIIDFGLLTDSEVKDWFEELGIQRMPIRECPVKGAASFSHGTGSAG